MDKNVYNQQQQIFIHYCKSLRPEFSTFIEQPCLEDDTEATGFDTHYLYHVAWAVRKIIKASPNKHTDISSALNFSAFLSALIPTTFIDYRPADIELSNLHCQKGDLTDAGAWKPEQFDSISCMHVVEHIGLGRYGDNLDVNADLNAINTLKKIVKQNGKLYFVVPVGKPSINFNAHRIYLANKISEYFADQFELQEFYFIPGPQNMHPIVNCHFEYTLQFPYGCGCFEFRKY
jgi:SAM-dependent methyltransferase